MPPLLLLVIMMQQATGSSRHALRYALAGLADKGCAPASTTAAKQLLSGLRGTRQQLKAAVQEVIAGTEAVTKHAARLRLQLAEFAVLDCCSHADVRALLPLLAKQANLVLAAHRAEAAVINSLAALLSSLVARLLQGEEDDGGHATMHAAAAAGGSSEDGSSAVLPAEQVGELLLLPLIKSTYRDPEQLRVSAGSTVLLGLVEVLRAHTHQPGVVDTMRRGLALMLATMAHGSVAQRAPGVLLPVCTCVEVLGLGLDQESTGRLLAQCLKAAATKEPWQVRRDACHTLALLAGSLQFRPLGAAGSGAQLSVDDASSLELLHTPALDLLIRRKPAAMQVLEVARFDRIAAVRAAAAAAHTQFSLLPDPPAELLAPDASPSASPDKAAAGNGRKQSGSRQPHLAGDCAEADRRGCVAPRFVRPHAGRDAERDFGILVFAPPYPPPPFPALTSPPRPSAAAADGGDTSPTRTADQAAGCRRSVEAASQTLVQAASSPSASAASVPCWPGRGVSSAPQVPLGELQQPEQQQPGLGLAALLTAASSCGSPLRLDVSHHVYGRVELGISYSTQGSPVAAAASNVSLAAMDVTSSMPGSPAAGAVAAAAAAALQALAGSGTAGSPTAAQAHLQHQAEPHAQDMVIEASFGVAVPEAPQAATVLCDQGEQVAGQQQPSINVRASSSQSPVREQLASRTPSDRGSSSHSSPQRPPQSAGRQRQRWQLPSGPTDLHAAAASEQPAGSSDTVELLASELAPAPGADAGAPGSPSSLDVLRSVGERVQQLLESISRQPSSGSRNSREALSPSSPQRTSPAAAAAAAAAAAVHGSGNSSSGDAAEAGAVQPAVGAESGTTAAAAAQPDADALAAAGGGGAAPRTDTPCAAAHTAAVVEEEQQASQPDDGSAPLQRLTAAVSMAELELPDGQQVQHQQQQQQQQQLASEPWQLLEQLSEEAQPSIAQQPGAPAGTCVGAAQSSGQLPAEPADEGISKVDKALERLQSLRSTLRRISASDAEAAAAPTGVSDSSLGQRADSACSIGPDSLPAARRAPGGAVALPAAETSAVAPPVAVPDSVRAGGGERAIAAPPVLAGKGDVLASAKDWLKEISERLQQQQASVSAADSQALLPQPCLDATQGQQGLQWTPALLVQQQQAAAQDEEQLLPCDVGEPGSSAVRAEAAAAGAACPSAAGLPPAPHVAAARHDGSCGDGVSSTQLHGGESVDADIEAEMGASCGSVAVFDDAGQPQQQRAQEQEGEQQQPQQRQQQPQQQQQQQQQPEEEQQGAEPAQQGASEPRLLMAAGDAGLAAATDMQQAPRSPSHQQQQQAGGQQLVAQEPAGPGDAARLQQLLADSDDALLLLSFALKLDGLGRRPSSPQVTPLQLPQGSCSPGEVSPSSPGGSEGAWQLPAAAGRLYVNSPRRAAGALTWRVTHNNLFVASPAGTPRRGAAAADASLPPVGSQQLDDEQQHDQQQQQQQQLMTAPAGLPACEAHDAQLLDAVLTNVLGVGLQQLRARDEQARAGVAALASHCGAQLQAASAAMGITQSGPGVDGAAARDVRPVLVLVMQELRQELRQQCLRLCAPCLAAGEGRDGGPLAATDALQAAMDHQEAALTEVVLPLLADALGAPH